MGGLRCLLGRDRSSIQRLRSDPEAKGQAGPEAETQELKEKGPWLGLGAEVGMESGLEEECWVLTVAVEVSGGEVRRPQ